MFHTTLFADDTTFSLSNYDYNTMIATLISELTTIENWTNVNRLTMNVPQTEGVLFSNRLIINNINNQNLPENQSLNYTNSCKLLRVIVDNKLTFNSNITYIMCKISCSAGILYKIPYLFIAKESFAS